MEDAIAAAHAVLADRFPDAVAAFLGGSTARGQDTATSDLDIVVVRHAGSRVFRQTTGWERWPVELFVHTGESVRTMFAWDRANRAPIMAFMCARGTVLLDRDGSAASIRAEAEATIAAGPAPVDPDSLEWMRYSATDLRDDLAGAHDTDELAAVGALALEQSAKLLCATRGCWQGRGKWLPRWLRAADAHLAELLLSGYHTLVRDGQCEPFLAALAAVLDACGGALREGYERDADAAMLAGPAAISRPS